MKLQINNENIKSIWTKINSKLVLIVILAIFIGFTTYLAFNLKLNIVPDEGFHYSMSQSFARTVGVPYETPASLERGIFIRQNPYLGHWIFARALNFFSIIRPNSTNWQQLVFLRLINVMFSIGTVIFTYLFSKELARNKWWGLLPVFLLTNTMMFVVLSSGVSYDNLTNFFSIISIYFLLRILNKKEFISNSLGMLIFLLLGALTKFTVIPLALGMIIVWIIFIIFKKPSIEMNRLRLGKNIVLLIFILILVGLNVSIYGVNLIKFQSLTPHCQDYYSEEFCLNAPFLIIYHELRLPEKLTIFSAVKQGYPEPIRYTFDTWIRAMMLKIFGVMGNLKSYYPTSAAYFHILLYWFILLFVRYFRKTTFKLYNLIAIFIYYSLVLFINNYDDELTFGFLQVALQGRYIFPVISLAYGLLGFGLMKIPNRIVKYATLGATIALFIYGGPLKFIIYYDSIFASWFI
jgi:hypothetical protein